MTHHDCIVLYHLLYLISNTAIQVGGQQDFLRVAQKLTIEASRNLLNSDFLVPIPINDDKIDEDPEGFIVLIEVSEETANNRLAPLINYINDGLTIGIIVDDDGQ